MQAPGSRLGAEPWEFVVVKNKETLAKLGEIKPRVTNAPVAIVLVANIERAFYKTVWQQDMGAAAENMLLEAVNLGLGGLWNGVDAPQCKTNYKMVCTQAPLYRNNPSETSYNHKEERIRTIEI